MTDLKDIFAQMLPIQLLPFGFSDADPRPPMQPAPAQQHEQAGERLLGRRVLIVEDEAFVAMELQFAFEDEGAEVIGPAMSLAQALSIVEQQADIDYAVLDVDIAGVAVYPVAHILQQRGVPFLFHTGHGSRSKHEALFPGAMTCFKPTLPEVLVSNLLALGD